jgi:hypothetical protein
VSAWLPCLRPLAGHDARCFKHSCRWMLSCRHQLPLRSGLLLPLAPLVGLRREQEAAGSLHVDLQSNANELACNDIAACLHEAVTVVPVMMQQHATQRQIATQTQIAIVMFTQEWQQPAPGKCMPCARFTPAALHAVCSDVYCAVLCSCRLCACLTQTALRTCWAPAS